MMHRLVLFDIDGTLIDSGGAGSKAMTRVFYDLFSIESAFAGVQMGGKTDIQIIKEGLKYHGIEVGDGIIPSILGRYISRLREKIENREKYVHAGVVELLTALKATKGYHLALLTGNIEEGARIKLGAFDLNQYFPFGAFGSDHEDRTKLLPIALKRLKERTGIGLRPRDCLVVGDTPRDVDCSRPFGAVSIAVATGPFTVEALKETGADYVLEDLTGAMAVIGSCQDQI